MKLLILILVCNKEERIGIADSKLHITAVSSEIGACCWNEIPNAITEANIPNGTKNTGIAITKVCDFIVTLM